jgi:hypothetical protein
VFSPLLRNICGKGQNVGAALNMWKTRARQQQQQYNFDFVKKGDLHLSRKLWVGSNKKDQFVYLINDELNEKGVVFIPETEVCESLSSQEISLVFDERVWCSRVYLV